MSIQEELKSLIEDDILFDIEDYIDELFEIVASKKDDERTKEELVVMQEMRDNFNEILDDLKSGEMDDEECKEIIEEINEMRKEND